MMERIYRKNNTSSPASSAIQKSLFESRPFTIESYQSSSPIDLEAPKTIRPSLNWQNISVEAPSRNSSTSSDSLAEATEAQEQEDRELVQTKLKIGSPGDFYEQEADNMAAKVMAMPEQVIAPPETHSTAAKEFYPAKTHCRLDSSKSGKTQYNRQS